VQTERSLIRRIVVSSSHVFVEQGPGRPIAQMAREAADRVRYCTGWLQILAATTVCPMGQGR